MENREDLALDSFTYSTTTGTNTPSSTTASMDDTKIDRYATDQIRKETVPWPGGTYIIREPKSGKQITLINGLVCMAPHLGDQGGYHWLCTSTDGWLGFRSPVSGLHLGHNGESNRLMAIVPHHRDLEYFATRGHPDGGQLLFVKQGDSLWPLSVRSDREIAILSEGGTVWEFVKV
ncbi:hypothetical protein F4781DRAFT_388065 [Annulohypoxylon bovei var. microspora]|nr:hypothetical protein F4781DRAFT_388065 [Annulohypoxylon bovei var. microspora]